MLDEIATKIDFFIYIHKQLKLSCSYSSTMISLTFISSTIIEVLLVPGLSPILSDRAPYRPESMYQNWNLTG